MSVRILLADDHRLVRQGLRSLIEKCSGMEVVAEAEDGREAVRRAREEQPDVVIMDIDMPGLNGMEATRQVIAALPGVRVIALSMHSDKRFVRGMLEAGAAGFLLKDCGLKEGLSESGHFGNGTPGLLGAGRLGQALGLLSPYGKRT